MDLEISLIDKSMPVPQYHSQGAVAFDLYARIETIIEPFTPTIVPTNLIVKVPDGYFLMLASRSSTPIRKKLIVANGVGVIDQDFHGEKDEIGALLLNFSNKPIIVEKGERIAQAILVKVAKVDNFLLRKDSKKSSRGGFGSTGK